MIKYDLIRRLDESRDNTDINQCNYEKDNTLNSRSIGKNNPTDEEMREKDGRTMINRKMTQPSKIKHVKN